MFMTRAKPKTSSTLTFSFGIMGLAIFLVSCAPPALPPEDSCNFVQNSESQRVSWKVNLPIEIYIHTSVPEGAIAAMARAVARWEYGVGRQLFRLVGVSGVTGNTPSRDGISAIYWMNQWPADHTREQARTTIYWVDDRIEEADIMLNSSNYSLYSRESTSTPRGQDLPLGSEIDLESLMVHELGHMLGLQHNEAQGSVMAKILQPAHDRRRLAPVDSNSVLCEYGG